jgi:holo-[acyl-carrier protein] synthase
LNDDFGSLLEKTVGTMGRRNFEPENPMLYTGVDLIELDRIAQTVRRHGERFFAHVYTVNELAYCDGRISALAVRFAAKEAAAKALGTGLIGLGGGDGVHWADIEVVNDVSRKPSLRLHRGAARRATELGWQDVALSLSHTRNHAIAMVVVTT